MLSSSTLKCCHILVLPNSRETRDNEISSSTLKCCHILVLPNSRETRDNEIKKQNRKYNAVINFHILFLYPYSKL